MANHKRVLVTWNGLGALPGVSVFHCDDATDPTGNLTTYFTAIAAMFPQPLVWQVPNSGDTIDSATGLLTGSWTGTGGATINAGAAKAYAAGTGAYIAWQTPVIVAGRRLKGRTFMAPITFDGYDTAGTLATAVQAAFQTAANTLVAASKVGVWHRPTPSAPTSGVWTTATAVTCPDKVTSLRSRRN